MVTLLYDDDQNFSTFRPDPFVPLHFGAQLAFWLDANDSSSISESGGVVNEWKDLSGNELHVGQTDTAKRPISGSTTQNGLNVLVFDGDDFLEKSSTNFQNDDHSWFIVAEIDSGGVNHSADGIFTYGAWGTGQWHLRANNASQFRGKIYADGNALSTTNFSNSALSGYQMYSIEFNRVTGKHSNWLNGTINDSNITYTTPLLSGRFIRVFTGSNASYSPVGKMAEIICVKSVASSDRLKIEGYLAHKWGIQSKLDSSHPYDSSPPTANIPLKQIELGTQSVGAVTKNLTGLNVKRLTIDSYRKPRRTFYPSRLL